MLCCQGFEVKNYDFTLGRLAYESLRPAQDPDRVLSFNERSLGVKQNEYYTSSD
jgi:hypothetical protein